MWHSTIERVEKQGKQNKPKWWNHIMPTRQKIVFIVPPTSLSEIFKGMGDVGNKQPFMGILLLAWLTRKLGYETHIIDSYALNLKTQDILIKLGKIKPDCKDCLQICKKL